MNRPTPVKIARKIVTLLSIAALFGCASRSSVPAPYMYPERLYLQDRPCTRLYVEIDRTEGVDLPSFFGGMESSSTGSSPRISNAT